MTGNESSRPLRILHLGKYFYPDSGGIETVTKDIAQGAARAGNDVTVLCFGHVDRPLEERCCDVHVLRVPIWKLTASQPIGWQYLREFRRKVGAFDIVHVHVPNMLAALAVTVTRIPGRVVVHWHSDVVGKGLLGKLMRPLEWLMLRRADAIVTTSCHYAKASPTLSGFGAKLHVIPIGIADAAVFQDVDDDTSSGVEEAARALSADLPDNTQIILAVGRLVAYKGFDVLVQAARQLHSDCRVIIVGGGERLQELGSQVRAQGLSGRVILAGRLDDESLRSLFQRAAVFCLPSVSRAEAFGVVLLEAMAHGLPIVASDIAGSGVPWVNRHLETGLNVPVGDASALASALTQLLADPDQRLQMGHRARQRFETEFTAELATQRFLDLYRRLAECVPAELAT